MAKADNIAAPEPNGVAPTGKRIDVRGVQIARFEGGQSVERWGASDELGILKPLGADLMRN